MSGAATSKSFQLHAEQNPTNHCCGFCYFIWCLIISGLVVVWQYLPSEWEKLSLSRDFLVGCDGDEVNSSVGHPFLCLCSAVRQGVASWPHLPLSFRGMHQFKIFVTDWNVDSWEKYFLPILYGCIAEINFLKHFHTFLLWNINLLKLTWWIYY